MTYISTPINVIWTAERVDQLKLLWNQKGIPASAIAIELGEGLTRNAVLGKVHRLKLLPHRIPNSDKRSRKKRRRATATRQVGHRLTPIERAAARAEYGQKVLAETPLTAPNSAPVTLLDAKPDQCRFVLDEHTRGSKTLMCGAPVEDGSWCAFHHATVFHARAA